MSNTLSRKDKRLTRESLNPGTQTRNDEKRSEKVSCNERQRDLSIGPIIEDGIRKEVTSREMKAQRNWQKKYGYYSGEIFQKILAEECVKAGLPEDTFKRKPPEDPAKKSPIPLKAYPHVPRTSSALIGWRSSREECNLEFTGRMYVSAKSTIESPLNQPGEFRVTKQRFIFLG